MAKYIVGVKNYRLTLDDKYPALKIEVVDKVHRITGPKTYENIRAHQLFREVVDVVNQAASEPSHADNIDKYKDIKELWLPKQGGELGKYLANIIEIKRKWI